MAASFKLSIVAPDRLVAEVETSAVTAPGMSGYFGVWAGHQPIISALKPGILEYLVAGERHSIVIGGGFAEFSNNKMTVLADEAVMATEVDLARAEGDLEEARKVLRGESSSMSAEEATEVLDRAMAKIRAAKKV